MEENRCPQCGANVDAGAYACKYCGAPLQQAQPAQQPVQPPVQQPYAAPQQPVQPPVQQPYAAPQQPVQPPYAVPQQPYVVQQPVMVPAGYPQKSKMAAGLLGIFLGGFGVHNFYLGYTGKAVAQLLITILTCGFGGFVSGIWGLVEGIMILTGSIAVDGKNVPLKD